MSKNNQRNLSEINLGNETYSRGYADGVAGNPKTIKKTHRHVHRYHIGYRHGQEQAKRATGPTLDIQKDNVVHVHHKLPAAAQPKGFWVRLKQWVFA